MRKIATEKKGKLSVIKMSEIGNVPFCTKKMKEE